MRCQQFSQPAFECTDPAERATDEQPLEQRPFATTGDVLQGSLGRPVGKIAVDQQEREIAQSSDEP
jgi:hypothetical protein